MEGKVKEHMEKTICEKIEREREREVERERIVVPQGRFCGICPYLDTTKHCKLSGVYKDGYHLETYCLSSSNWLKCANYESHAR